MGLNAVHCIFYHFIQVYDIESKSFKMAKLIFPTHSSSQGQFGLHDWLIKCGGHDRKSVG